METKKICYRLICTAKESTPKDKQCCLYNYDKNGCETGLLSTHKSLESAKKKIKNLDKYFEDADQYNYYIIERITTVTEKLVG